MDFENFQHKFIYGPSLRCNNGVSRDAPGKKQGCVYISGLSVDYRCVRALMNYARVLLISTTALPGRQFVQGLNALGVPLVSSRIVRVALRGVNSCEGRRRAAPPQDRRDQSCRYAGDRYAAS